MRWTRRLVICVLGAALGAAATVAARAEAPAGPARLVIPVVTAAPPLDPKADLAAWKDAAAVTLPWDVSHQRLAPLPAAARVATDGKIIYVRFDVPQRETLLAQQHTNNVGDGTDDEVWIDLWPNGNGGFYYQFAANSNGTRWQYSSENTAYAPTWTSFGAASGNDYTVTMAIPLNVMRGSGSGDQWKVQFVRVIRSTGERQIWAYGAAQTNGDDVTYAGALSGMPRAVASRPKPRVALYGLGTYASNRGDLTTSRMGGDFSVPVTATSSIYGTIHPDFSNVEVDQQTISPTAFQRSFNEVRPFFTQGANFYDNFACDACPFIRQLYTPAIPTPRDGFAFEGKQGNVSFAGFDALGTRRNDGAANVAWRSPDNHWRLSAQSVAANLPGLTDHVATTGLSWQDNQHVSAYFDYGSESGTNVLAGNEAQRYDGGMYYYTNTFGFAASARRVGRYYQPVDGFVQHADITGYSLYENKIFTFAKTSWLDSVQVGTFIDRYRARNGALNQTDNSFAVDVLTRNRIDVNVGIGSGYLLLDSGVFTPITQNSVSATWHSGTANDPGNFGFHASSATPTMLSLSTGRFGPGRVDSWVRSSTMRAGPRGTLSLEADDTRGYEDNGRTNVQWLERAGYTYAAGPNSSYSLGVRRIIGTPPIVDLLSPPAFTSAWNLSFAYYRRSPHGELYFAYGDASRLSTVPQLILKYIHYIGAEKGT